MYTFKLSNVPDLVGVVVDYANKGEIAKYASNIRTTSDDPMFYRYVEQISDVFLNAHMISKQFSVDSIHRLLIVLHAECTADVYLNDFEVLSQIMPKGPITKGQIVLLKDIANIERVAFPQVQIEPTDKVVFCFRMGWRFGLYFDLTQRVSPAKSEKPVNTRPLDIKRMEIEIGELYRYLAFYHVYKTLEAQFPFETMVGDGWFPFIEIVAKEFQDLACAYEPGANTDVLVADIVNHFTSERIASITGKWWGKSVFQEKKPIISAAINAYQQNSSDGYINCYKNLATEIEGILRKVYFDDTGRGRVNSSELILHIIEKAKAKSQSDVSLFLPQPFLEYLQATLFAGFNVESGDVELSRHSSSHGVANPEAYRKERALQLILILDQLYYYM